jgi:MYXO-CTERM domain-containing protein
MYHSGLMKPIRRLLLLVSAAFAGLLLTPGFASAHILLTSPVPRTEDLKDGPCGGIGALNKRGKKITTFKPGQTITVKWKETVEHPGHFRISFDENGQSKFVDPKSFTDLNTSPSVMVDNIKDKTADGATYSQDITLPNIECDNCTLQVIQVMTDKEPYGDGDDLYYQCADITLSNAAVGEEPDAGDTSSSSSSSGAPPPTTTTSDGCQTTTTGSAELSGFSVFALGAIAALGAITRRRRSRPSRSPTSDSPSCPPSSET